MDPALLTHEELLARYKELKKDYDHFSAQMDALIDGWKKENDLKLKMNAAVGALGVVGNTNPIMKIFEDSQNESDFNTAVEYLLKKSSDQISIKEFVRYYNTHNRTKIDEEKVNIYLEMIAQTPERDYKNFVSEYMAWLEKKSELRWLSDDESLAKFYAILTKKGILKISEPSFRLHFQGYYNRCPRLHFEDFTLVDIIYLFQGLELAGYIQPFMEFYASNLSQHTEYSQQRFQEAKSKNGGASKIEYRNGKLIKAIINTKKSYLIDDILNNL